MRACHLTTYMHNNLHTVGMIRNECHFISLEFVSISNTLLVQINMKGGLPPAENFEAGTIKNL